MRMTNGFIIAGFFLLTLTLSACDQASPPLIKQNDTTASVANDQTATKIVPMQSPVRWYQNELVSIGTKVFQQHCIACHGPRGVGSENWQVKKDNGRYPPPPLNGTAHTWHHPMPFLMDTINDGSIEEGGEMPAFKDSLNPHEKLGVIAYLQQYWPDEIYRAWEERFPDQFKQTGTLQQLR